jgi:hypothetical protein
MGHDRQRLLFISKTRSRIFANIELNKRIDQCKDTKAISNADMRTTAKTAQAMSVTSALRMRPETP